MKRLLVLLFIPLVFACDSKITNEELADDMKGHMAEIFKEKPEFENIEIVDLVVIHVEDYQYDGTLTIKEPDSDKKKRYKVLITFDGQAYSWRILNKRFDNLLD